MSDIKLTWDNLDQYIDSIPKDENGHFLPNPRAKEKLVVSTERDNWSDHSRDAMTGMAGQDLFERAIDVLLDDGIIQDREAWSEWFDKTYARDGEIYHCPRGSIGISTEPTNDPKESLLKVGIGKLYINVELNKVYLDVKQEPINQEITTETKNVNLEEAPEWKPTDILSPIDKTRKVAEEKLTDLANPLLEKAKANLAKLDTAAAEKEFRTAAENMKRAKEIKENGLADVLDSPLNRPDMSSEELKLWRIENAKSIIGKMDAEFVAKGRLNVNDKTLMNSKTDLNQLIPFKYPWSWSIYLTSCERHWMPGEVSLDRCVDQWNRFHDDGKLLLARARLTHKSQKRLFPEHALLNMYRMLENPECRQYLLRQGMESVTTYHAWMEIEETLQMEETLIDGQKPLAILKRDEDYFKARHYISAKQINFMHGLENTTDKPEDLANFIKAFIILYTHTTFLMPVIANYQVITALEFNETCQPLAQILQLLNRDSISQFNFGKLFVSGVMEENPDVFNQTWFDEIFGTLEALMHCELNLISTLKAGENERNDVEYIFKHFMDEMLSEVNPHYIKSTLPNNCDRGREFVRVLESVAPVVDHSAGLGGFTW